MFERFTDRARRVVVLAQEEARILNHNYIGTEHLLLGLIHEEEGLGWQALHKLGFELDWVRSQVETKIGIGTSQPQGHIPFTPRAKKCMELSLREALRLGHTYIGTEHLLLGLLREGEGVAAQVLMLKTTLGTVEATVLDLMKGFAAQVAGGETTVAAADLPQEAGAAAKGPRCTRCRSELETSVRYRILEVAGPTGDDAAARMLVVYCTSCGQTLDTVVAPED